MARRLALGDLGLAAGFAAMGLVWIWQAQPLALWERETPGPGFLPLLFGALLLALAALAAMQALLAPAGPAGESEPVGKPLLVLGSVLAAVVGLETAGFALSVFLLLLVLFALVERKPPLASLLAAAGVASALHLVFAVWLAVPLPMGPFGD